MVRYVDCLWSWAVVAQLAQATPLQSRKYDYSVKEVHNPPRKWTQKGAAPADTILNLHIALKMPRWNELERHLLEISDPFHARYGQHLSHDEVSELARPNADALESVHCWLADHGITADQIVHSAAKDNIKFSIPVSKAEILLNTKYHVYQHEDGASVIRTPEWSLPKELHQHVAAIQPTNSFLRAAPRRTTFRPILESGKDLIDSPVIRTSGTKGASSLESSRLTTPINSTLAVNGTDTVNEAPMERPMDEVCNPELVTAACLRRFYRTASYIPTQLDRNYVGIANYLNETSMDTDLQTYLQRYRPDAEGKARIDFKLLNNGTNDQTLTTAQALHQQNAEGNLDGQTLVGIVHPMRVKAYNTGGSPPFKPDEFTPTNTNEPYLEWLDYMLANETNLPSVVSTSYGDNEQTVPLDYAVLVCQRLAMLGSRGVTLLFASGDNGVGSDGDCTSNDGKATPMFTPAFPDGCPYVTSVGGTKNFSPEVAAWDPRNKFASGGGFSNYFAMPEYQKAVVTDYIGKLKGNYSDFYNKTGRAYPDLAAQSQAYSIIWMNRTIALDGTSASTPAVAGIIALLNDHLLANNRPTLGFLNPWLYKVGWQGLNDIVSGTARGCDVDGFPATTGWDAVTGWGSPDFPKLQQLLVGANATGAAGGVNGTAPGVPSAPPRPQPVLPVPLASRPTDAVKAVSGDHAAEVPA